MKYYDEISGIRKENFERAVNAVRRDDVDALKKVLNVLPEFNTMFYYGSNLLYLSCHFKKNKVFEYLLNLNCFDLEKVDDCGCTGPGITIHSCNIPSFSVKLINRYVDESKGQRTYLHHAMDYLLLETAKLLLQKGLDPNAQDYYGHTSLHLALDSYSDSKVDEGVGLLLEYGADTAIYSKNGFLPFDYAVTHRQELHIQEHLFYCTFDSHSAGYTMQSDVLDELLGAPIYDNVSPLLDNVMDVLSDVIFEEYPIVNFFKISPDLLKKFVERFGYIIRRAFSIMEVDGGMDMNISNIEILLNSELHFDTVKLISKLDLWRIFSHYYSQECKEELSSRILYLLSYGLNVTSYDCVYIYQYQEYSDLFRTILLHLNYTGISQIDSPLVKIIVDIHCDLNTILSRFNRFSYYKIESLLGYFANTELRLLCERTGAPNLVNKVRQLPTVPSLLQLARDETRRHIVRRYKLEKPSQYYWVLRRLFFGTDYEKILSFESKLYG